MKNNPEFLARAAYLAYSRAINDMIDPNNRFTFWGDLPEVMKEPWIKAIEAIIEVENCTMIVKPESELSDSQKLLNAFWLKSLLNDIQLEVDGMEEDE